MELHLPPDAVRPHVENRDTFHGLDFAEIRYTQGLYMPPHTHAQVFLDFCLQGTMEDCWNKNRFIRGPFTLNFLPAGALHGTHFPENARTFQVILETSWLERMPQIARLTETPLSYRNSLPNWIAMRMVREFRQQDTLTPLVLEGMLLELMAAIARQSSFLVETHCPRWLERAKEFLHAHFTEPIAVETLANAVGVHPSHLMRSFRQFQGCTVGDYVRKLRIDYACHLLTTSQVPPAQIAITAGFADQSHFSRMFKASTGMTPGEFQKLCGHARH